MPKKSNETPKQQIPAGIPAGHAITLAEEKLVRTTEQALMSAAPALMAAGRIQAANFFQKTATVVVIKEFDRLRETKEYKGLVYIGETGKPLTVGTIEEYCEHFLGISYQTLFEQSKNLSMLGEELFQASRTIGLTTQHLRDLRKLPADAQEAVKEAIQAKDKEAVLELLQDMAVKFDKEKNSLAKRANDVEADYAAQEKIILDKNKKIDAQEKLLHKLQNRSGDWHPRAFEICMENTRIGAGVLEAMDRLDVMRDAILNEDFGEEEREAAIEAMAVVHYDTINQIVDRVAEVMAACEEVFLGYKEKARPILQVFGEQQG